MFKKGWQKIISRMNAMQMRQQNSLAHNTGPHNSEPMTKGFLHTSIRHKQRTVQ